MHAIHWVRSGIYHLLWSYDSYRAAVGGSLANEWHVLHAEDGQILSVNVISEVAEALEVESSLTKHGADERVSLDVGADLPQDFILGMRR